MPGGYSAPKPTGVETRVNPPTFEQSLKWGHRPENCVEGASCFTAGELGCSRLDEVKPFRGVEMQNSPRREELTRTKKVPAPW